MTEIDKKKMAAATRRARAALKKKTERHNAIAVMAQEIERLKERYKYYRKLRQVRVFIVREPNGTIVGSYTVPEFVYERVGSAKRKELEDKLAMEFNQELTILEPIICDTWVGLESEMTALNQIDDQKEDDGVEDNK